jgi:nucleotide-binding universal stress UspA family protein
LYLTDFSEPSEAALPFAVSIAREFGSKVHALHVLIPKMYTYTTPDMTMASMEAQEEAAQRDIERLGSQLTGLPHECIVERGVDIWQSLERAIKDYNIDLIVLGTRGRTGAQKLLLGSVAEEVFRRSQVPVLTIGPEAHGGVHKSAKFRSVLFPTDFTQESLGATPYALSFAEENQARLILLHVMKEIETKESVRDLQDAASNAASRLYEVVPSAAGLWCRPEAVVQIGNPAERILQTAKDRGVDLIVLGLRDVRRHLGAATHLERTTAHKVVAHAACPVLTMRG